MGLIQSVVANLQGSFKFKIVFDDKISAALSLTKIVRHGVLQGVCINTFVPTALGARSDFRTNVCLSIVKHMAA